MFSTLFLSIFISMPIAEIFFFAKNGILILFLNN